MPQDESQIQKQELSPDQIAKAIGQGAKIIESAEMIPREVAMSGSLPVITGIMNAIATGQIRLCSPEQMKIIEEHESENGEGDDS